jgi:hypothetical protein
MPIRVCSDGMDGMDGMRVNAAKLIMGRMIWAIRRCRGQTGLSRNRHMGGHMRPNSHAAVYLHRHSRCLRDLQLQSQY